jgi:D-beta-D-heptose 7-phosphate kinase/D-beta-D-heptose 1-phosphate adenosyltransferase
MENNKIIFINGCFDLLHRGHIELFQYAKKLGKYLIVAIDSDSRVKELKGSSRPINNQFDRMFMLLSIKYVDEVKIFSNQNELEKLIKQISPDIMIVGSDYKDKKVIGSNYSKKLVFFNRIDEYATTKIIQSIIDRR